MSRIYQDGAGVPFSRGAVEYQIMRAREDILTAYERLVFLHGVGVSLPLATPHLADAVKNVVGALEKELANE